MMCARRVKARLPKKDPNETPRRRILAHLRPSHTCRFLSSLRPMCSPTCAGVFLLLLGILGGFIVPFFGLFPFIAGCVLVCGCCGGSKGGCVKCVSITGIIFAVIGLIVFIAIGAWILTATQTFCDVAATSIATGCALNVTDLSGDTTGQAAAAQAAGCSLAGDQLNEGCGWVATLGAVMIAIPSIYEFLVVVLFTAALCGIKNEAESGGGVPMSGIVMNKQ